MAPLQLTGIIPPLVTPFTSSSQDLDEDALRAQEALGLKAVARQPASVA